MSVTLAAPFAFWSNPAAARAAPLQPSISLRDAINDALVPSPYVNGRTRVVQKGTIRNTSVPHASATSAPRPASPVRRSASA